MRALSLGALLGTLIAAGCIAEAPRDQPREFRLPIGDLEVPAAAEERRPTLRVARVGGPSWARQERMFYQLGYRSPAVLGWYGEARWAEPPAVMLARALRGKLAATGRWQAVLGPGDPASARHLLRLELTELMQVFPDTERSFGRLRARAELIDEETAEVLRQRTFSYRVAAPSADAPGGVQALGEAGTRLGSDLLSWLLRSDSGAG